MDAAGVMSEILPNLEYDVIADTSCLWTNGPGAFASPGFDATWLESVGLARCNLLIPAVVVGELMYQKFVMSLAALANAEKNLATLAKTTGLQIPRLPTHAEIKAGIQLQANNWLLHQNARVLEVPITAIQWQKLVDDAVWRNPPFESDNKSEKGFRDRLILETVIHHASENPGRRIAFIVGDQLLKEAVTSFLGPESSVEVFDTAAGFVSRMKLVSSTLDREFAVSLSIAAAELFYDPNSKDCLALKQDLFTKIVATHQTSFVPPPIRDAIYPGDPWRASTPISVRFGETDFQRKEGRDCFVWRSTMVFYQDYRHKWFAARFRRISKFVVEWTSIVDAAGRLQSPEIGAITPLPPRFQDISFESGSPGTLASSGSTASPSEVEEHQQAYEPFYLPTEIKVEARSTAS